MRAPVHAAPLLSFLFLYSFLSSFYPPHPLFCQFPATTSPCPLPPPSSFAAYSFFLPNAFLSLLLFFSFPYGSRHIAEFRYIVRERNNASKLGQLPWRILGDSLERKMGRKHFFRLLRKWRLINLYFRFLLYSIFTYLNSYSLENYLPVTFRTRYRTSTRPIKRVTTRVTNNLCIMRNILIIAMRASTIWACGAFSHYH